MNRSALHIIHKKWKDRIFLKCFLWLLLFFGVAFAMNGMDASWHMLAGVGLLAAGFIGLELRKLPKKEDVVKLVNQQYQPVEYSVELLFQIPEGELQVLQQQRVNIALAQQLPTFRYPISWKNLYFMSAMCILGLVIYSFIEFTSTSQAENLLTETQALANGVSISSIDSISLSSFHIYSSPPSYTGIRASKQESFDISVPERSAVSWELKFNGTPKAVWLRFSSGDSLGARFDKDTYR
ncbi:MAG: hypothetical protein AAFY41_17755, partial [Bacteroidota bacterium]